MKKSKLLFYMLLFIGVFILAGCSSKSDNVASTAEDTAMYQSEAKAEVGFNQEEVFDQTLEKEEIVNEKEPTNVAEARKLIKRVYLSVETKEFDEFQLFINKQIELVGGYTESSETSGNSYSQDKSSRYANFVIRIPVNHLNNFVESVGNESNILRQSSTQEDITLKYIDTQSHNKALKIEQERLLLLLSKAEKLADIITLEERLSQVRYEIETYESEIRTYDNLVDYSTITIDIQEVSHITPAVSRTIGERIHTGLSNSLIEIQTSSQDLFIGFIIFLPYFIIWAVVIGIIGIIVLYFTRKKKPNTPLEQDAITKEIVVDEKENKES